MDIMERSFINKERRSHPRFIIDLPLEYRDMNESGLKGGIVANVSDRGLLIEIVRDTPIGTELNVTVLFPKGFELANFKVVTKIVWKKPYWKEDGKGNQYWEGYRYGLELIQIFDEDRRKLSLLLSERFASEEISPPSMQQVLLGV